MDLEVSDQVGEMIARVELFMKEHIYPREIEYWEWVDNPENLWQYPPWHAGLKEKAKEAAAAKAATSAKRNDPVAAATAAAAKAPTM